MARKFACKDMGFECSFEARAKTDKDLLVKVAQHAREAHKIEKVDSEMERKVLAVVKDA